MKLDPAKIATTESLFRDVNERIAESAVGGHMSGADFFCECADPTCTERVTVELDDYEQVRSNGTDFLVLPGHELPAFEHVISRRRGYQVVRKVEKAVAVAARRLNPRRRRA